MIQLFIYIHFLIPFHYRLLQDIGYSSLCYTIIFKVTQSCLILCNPIGLYSPWNSPGQNAGAGSLSLLPGHLPNPGIKPRSPALQVDSLPSEPPGKPKNTGVGGLSLLQKDLPNPGIEPRSPELQADSFPAEPPGKPKNTGVGSLSLLQGIFPTQKSNQGLLHCRQILYQLSYQGSPSHV